MKLKLISTLGSLCLLITGCEYDVYFDGQEPETASFDPKNTNVSKNGGWSSYAFGGYMAGGATKYVETSRRITCKGQKIEYFADGKKEITYPDGTKETIYPTGNTAATTPHTPTAACPKM